MWKPGLHVLSLPSSSSLSFRSFTPSQLRAGVVPKWAGASWLLLQVPWAAVPNPAQAASCCLALHGSAWHFSLSCQEALWGRHNRRETAGEMYLWCLGTCSAATDGGWLSQSRNWHGDFMSPLVSHGSMDCAEVLCKWGERSRGGWRAVLWVLLCPKGSALPWPFHIAACPMRRVFSEPLARAKVLYFLSSCIFSLQ